MKKFLIFIFCFFITAQLNSRDFKNTSNNYFDTFNLLLNKNFYEKEISFNFNQDFNNLLEKNSLKNLNFKYKKRRHIFSINFEKLEKEKINLDLNKKEYVDLSSFSFNFKQFWKHNISASFSYYYRKFSNFKFLNTDFKQEVYTINFSKYIKSNQISITLENIDLTSKKPYEEFYIFDDDQNKLTFSYQLNLKKNFSILFMYSLTKYSSEKFDDEDIFFTGLKYKFDFFKSFK